MWVRTDHKMVFKCYLSTKLAFILLCANSTKTGAKQCFEKTVNIENNNENKFAKPTNSQIFVVKVKQTMESREVDGAKQILA